MSDSVELTREQLYEMVWETPISKLGPQFGVSGNAILKICQKLGVPRTPRGYWARLQHGYPVDRPPLRKAKKESPESYILSPPQRSGPVAPQRRVELPVVTVKSRVAQYHPLVSALRSELKEGWQDQYGRIRSSCGISVSKASLSRASLILDALIRELEARDIHVTIEERGVFCRVESEEIRLELHEPSNRRRPKTQSEYGYPRWEYIPSGNLTLKLWSRFLYGYRTSWSDSTAKKLEEKLPEILLTFETVPEIIRAVREEEHIEQLRRARVQLCQRRRSLVFKYTRARALHVDMLAENLRKSRDIRAFVDAVDNTEDAPPKTVRLARWAALYADHLDPLTDFHLEKLGSQES